MSLAHTSPLLEGVAGTYRSTDVALRTPSATMSYRELEEATQQRAEEFRRAYEPGTLLHLAFRPTKEAIVSYLAALAAKMPLLVTADTARAGAASPTSDPDGPYADILRTYRPAASIDPLTGRVQPRNEQPGEPVHPDIAVLLSTSGSTGSKKLVKLSLDNLRANAQAIVRGLGLTSTDCAITLLPLHYSFGLSVLNSHLACGASIAVEECSVADPSFAEVLQRYGVSNVGVVPHMLQVLRTADGGRCLAGLRLVYQAGGKLDTADVQWWHRYLDEHGTDFRVMYGQTEATARMSIMPRQLMASHPDAVGAPLVGHSMRISDTGELVFSGPSVMLGYAEHPDDLNTGRTIHELYTGDLGELVPVDASGADVLLRITGRASDFVKLAGLRISCEQIRGWLAQQGIAACVTGDDSALRVAVDEQTSQSSPDAGAITEQLCARTGLTPAFIRVVVLPEFPLLDNGKLDRRRCAELADAAVYAQPHDQAHAQPNEQARTAGAAQQPAPAATEQVIASIAHALGTVPSAVRRDVSFVDNGGSSLSFVPVAMAFARAGVDVPTGWHHIPLADLLNAPNASSRSTVAPPELSEAEGGATKRGALTPSRAPRNAEKSQPRVMWLDSSLVLRAICAMTIVMTHATPYTFMMGGAHSLLVIAGVALGTFGLTVASSATRLRATARSLVAVVVPTVLVVLVGMAVTGRYGVSNLLFIHWWRPSEGASGSLWFIESYVLGMLVIMGLLAIPALYSRYRHAPFLSACVLTGVLLVWRFAVGAWDITQTRFEPPGVVWFIAAGIMISQARSRRQKLIAAAIVVAGSITLFEYATQWVYVVLVCAILLSEVRLPVPRLLVRPVGLIASASLYIYLIQFDILDQPVTEFITVPLSLIAGIALWKASTSMVAWLAQRRMV
ncbi:Long-chain-fatty-acid--CoA ligase [Corynebacterium ciconiae DSM 44920]|uniref:AMP-binding protein n=1 Tax=Corynebacterium ciconiae TaxID=227319 RepID=UPI000360977E|nr:AMP-binding protein [Corynebacterium ciconiae]WKD62141.1 Long-chain-fatty-acid--CoA ligase [Corynebacterium ciconiae DSM 44920]